MPRHREVRGESHRSHQAPRRADGGDGGADVTRDALEDLAESLQGALELVTKCQRKHVVRRFIGAGDMARELRLVQDDILRKVTIGSFATNVVQLGITLMTIAQASAPAPHPQNR